MLSKFPFSSIVLLAFLGIAQVQAQQLPLTGVHSGVDSQTGARPARRDILDLQNDLPTW